MKILKIVGSVILVIIMIAAVVGFVYVRSVARKGLPDYGENVTLPGLSGEVTVYRDEYGVPHIYAENESDLFKATGFCMAQDRLWQMDLLRRVCTGRLAEIFGKDLVEADLLMRALRISEVGQRKLKKTETHIVALIDDFCEGINHFIETHRKKLPPEFLLLRYEPEDWEPEHTFYIVSYMAWGLSMAWDCEVMIDKIRKKLGEEMCRDFFPDVFSQETVAYPGFELNLSELDLRSSLLDHGRVLKDMGLVIFSGSNNWAVSGKKSMTGKPLFANDMHLGLTSPGVWYPIHQVVEGQLNVSGLTVPGMPGTVVGHNEHIAWGNTNVMVDDMDFYLERINPENPHQYEFNGEWKDMEVRREKIDVKGGESVEEVLLFTHRGPVISRFRGVENQVLSMRWIGAEVFDEARSIYLVNRAKDWDDFKDAMSTFQSAAQNVIYADTSGNIGLYCCVGIPIRKGSGTNAILPGWTDEYDWQGFVPFEELPHVYNPESGYVSSANNKSVDNDYPYYISRWYALPYRIDRIREMLEEKEQLAMEDFRSMQADLKSKMVEAFKETIVFEVNKFETLDSLEKQVLSLLDSWDGVLTVESPEAAVFEVFRGQFRKNMLTDEMGADFYQDYLSSGLLNSYFVHNVLENKDSLWCDDVTTEGVEETFADMVYKSFKDTVEFLEAEFGTDPGDWRWGKLHTLTLKHPLGSVKLLDRLFNFNRGAFGVGGSNHTVCPYWGSMKEPFKVVAGASQRHVYSMADWDASITLIPTGVSGIPASPHYCDQTELYVDNLYHSDYFSRTLVEKHARYTMVFK